MDKAAKRLRWLAVFTFVLSPVLAWGSENRLIIDICPE